MTLNDEDSLKLILEFSGADLIQLYRVNKSLKKRIEPTIKFALFVSLLNRVLQSIKLSLWSESKNITLRQFLERYLDCRDLDPDNDIDLRRYIISACTREDKIKSCKSYINFMARDEIDPDYLYRGKTLASELQVYNKIIKRLPWDPEGWSAHEDFDLFFSLLTANTLNSLLADSVRQPGRSYFPEDQLSIVLNTCSVMTAQSYLIAITNQKMIYRDEERPYDLSGFLKKPHSILRILLFCFLTLKNLYENQNPWHILILIAEAILFHLICQKLVPRGVFKDLSMRDFPGLNELDLCRSFQCSLPRSTSAAKDTIITIKELEFKLLMIRARNCTEQAYSSLERLVMLASLCDLTSKTKLAIFNFSVGLLLLLMLAYTEKLLKLVTPPRKYIEKSINQGLLIFKKSSAEMITQVVPEIPQYRF